MVVLSVGLNPPADYEGLAEKFGIELDSHGFCKTDPVNPIATTRPGIYVSGAFQGPMDIPSRSLRPAEPGPSAARLLDYGGGT